VARFKLQVQDDDERPERWRDVKSADGELLVFDKEHEARARLEALFPVLVKLERFAAGPKRTRVIVIDPYQDVDEEREE
jgi:hypothetical protein